MGLFTNFICAVITLLLGLSIIWLSWDMVNISFVVSYLQDTILRDFWSTVALLLCGFLFILFALRSILSMLFSSKREKVLTLDFPQGRVGVTLFAIEDMLKKILEDKKEISHIRPKVFLKKKSLEILLKGDLTSEANLLTSLLRFKRRLKIS